VNEHFVIPHNALKKKVVEKNITSARTFEKYLIELVNEKKIFRIPEEKIRIPIYVVGSEIKRTYGSKGSPRVYYTTQKRLVALKKKFLKFYDAEFKSLNKKYEDFTKMTKNTPSKKRIIAINDFTTSFFVLHQIITSVYSLGAYWQDISFEINVRFEKLDTLQHLFFNRMVELHTDIYTKIFTERQIKYLKQSEIRPFNLGKVDYS
jgi:hypothetical protein